MLDRFILVIDSTLNIDLNNKRITSLKKSGQKLIKKSLTAKESVIVEKTNKFIVDLKKTQN